MVHSCLSFVSIFTSLGLRSAVSLSILSWFWLAYWLPHCHSLDYLVVFGSFLFGCSLVCLYLLVALVQLAYATCSLTLVLLLMLLHFDIISLLSLCFPVMATGVNCWQIAISPMSWLNCRFLLESNLMMSHCSYSMK